MQKKNLMLAAVCVMATVPVTLPLMAQQTGTSNPPVTVMEDTPAQPVKITPIMPEKAKPSAAVPAPVEDGAEATPTLKVRPSVQSVDADSMMPTNPDLDKDIVGALPVTVDQLPVGTVIEGRMTQEISTESTQEGTTLLFELTRDVVQNGRVVLPAGSSFTASITDVRSGRRIRGAAMVHIEPRALVMRDGVKIPLHAMLVDTDKFDDARVDNEGNLIRKDHVGRTLAQVGLVTGGGAAAGGVVAGGGGVLVGGLIGAVAGTVMWLKQDRQLHVSNGATMFFQLTTPIDLRPDSRTIGAE